MPDKNTPDKNSQVTPKRPPRPADGGSYKFDAQKGEYVRLDKRQQPNPGKSARRKAAAKAAEASEAQEAEKPNDVAEAPSADEAPKGSKTNVRNLRGKNKE